MKQRICRSPQGYSPHLVFLKIYLCIRNWPRMNVYVLGSETHPQGCPNSDLRRSEVVVLHRCALSASASRGQHACRPRRPCLTLRTSTASTSAARRWPRPARRRAPPNPLRTIPWISLAAQTCSRLSVKQHRLDLPRREAP